MMDKINLDGLPFEHKNLPEIRVKEEKGIQDLSRVLNKPILVLKNVKAYDPRFPSANFPITKEHSIMAVISDGVIYKYIFDIKKEEDENAK